MYQLDAGRKAANGKQEHRPALKGAEKRKRKPKLKLPEMETEGPATPPASREMAFQGKTLLDLRKGCLPSVIADKLKMACASYLSNLLTINSKH